MTSSPNKTSHHREPWPFTVYSRTMSFLSTREIIRLRKVCRSFKVNSEYDQLWDVLVMRDYPEFHLDTILERQMEKERNQENHQQEPAEYEHAMEYFFDQIVNSEIEDRTEFVADVKKARKTKGRDFNNNNNYDPSSSTQHPIFFCRGRLLYCYAGLATRFPAILTDILTRSNFDESLVTSRYRNLYLSSSSTAASSSSPVSSYLQSVSLEEREIDYESSIGMYRYVSPPATPSPSKWPRPEFSLLSQGSFKMEEKTTEEMLLCYSLLRSFYYEESSPKSSSPSKKKPVVNDVALYYRWFLFKDIGKNEARCRRLFKNPHLQLFSRNVNTSAQDNRYRNYSKEGLDLQVGFIDSSSSSTASDSSTRRLMSDKHDLVQFVTLFDALYVTYAFHLPRYHYYSRCMILTYLLNTGLSMPSWYNHLRDGDFVSYMRKPSAGRMSSSELRRVRYAIDRMTSTNRKISIIDVQGFPQLLFTSFVSQGKLVANVVQLALLFRRDLTSIPLVRKVVAAAFPPDSEDFFGRHSSYLLTSPSQWLFTRSGQLLGLISLGVVGIAAIQRRQKPSPAKTLFLSSPIRATQILLVNSVSMLTHSTSLAMIFGLGLSVIDSFGSRLVSAVQSEVSGGSSTVTEESSSSSTAAPSGLLISPETISLIYTVALGVIFSINVLTTSVLGVFDATMVGDNEDDDESIKNNLLNNIRLHAVSSSRNQNSSQQHQQPSAASILRNNRRLVNEPVGMFELSKTLIETKLSFLLNNKNKKDGSGKDPLFFLQYVLLVCGYGTLLMRGSYLVEIFGWPVLMECLCRFVSNL